MDGWVCGWVDGQTDRRVLPGKDGGAGKERSRACHWQFKPLQFL